MSRPATLRFFLALALLAGTGACVDFKKLMIEYCGRNPDKCSPIAVPSMKEASSRGNHTLVRGADGSVWAMGQNDGGQLGDGTLVANPKHRKVSGLESVESIAAGYRHSMALSRGRVMLWGTLGTNPIQKTPTPVPGLEYIKAIAAGEAHALALADQSEVWAWGSGPAGMASAVPVKVALPAGATIAQIAAGNAHSLALTGDGQVWAWGDNSHGQLGAGGAAQDMTPRRVQGLPSDIKLIVAGGYHSLVLTNTGEVWAWGDNSRGQLGNGNTTSSATPVRSRPPKPETITSLAAGTYHSLALISQTNALAWGDNAKKQLGIDPKLQLEFTSTPMDVKAVDNAESLAAGETFSLMVTSSGCLYGWGSNEKGQLGPGINGQTLSEFEYPVPIICQTPVHQPSLD